VTPGIVRSADGLAECGTEISGTPFGELFAANAGQNCRHKMREMLVKQRSMRINTLRR
jgi:hypothetical protein